MARAYSEDLRIRIVKAYEQGLGSIREIAQQFQVGKTFVSKLLQRWQEQGSVSPLPQGGGAKSKLESVHLEKLQKMVEEKNDITLAELKEGLKQSTGLEISVPTVHRGLEKLGLSRKKKTFHDPKQESEEVEAQKQNYKVLFWSILTENLVFLDETGMWLNFTRMYGRAKRGRRCHAKRPKQKGKIVTLIGAMALSGVIASLMYKGGTTKESFLFFIQTILVPVLWKGAVVVMDNLNVHTNQVIKEAIEAVGAKVLFLPTYSPELNAIELLWSKLKSWLRKVQPRTREELDQAVSTFVNSLNKEDVIGYFIEADARAALI